MLDDPVCWALDVPFLPDEADWDDELDGCCMFCQLEPVFEAVFALLELFELFDVLELFELPKPELALLFDEPALFDEPPSAWLAELSASPKLPAALDALLAAEAASDEPVKTEAAAFTAARTNGSMAFSISGYQSCEASRRMRTIFAACSSDSRCSRRASTACSR